MDEIIQFGTDGWRGVTGYNFTFENALRVARAFYSSFNKANPLVVLGYDTRFLSEAIANTLALDLSLLGSQVILSQAPCPSPTVSQATQQLSADGGLMITASHNPALYNGIKFKGVYGGSYHEEMVAEVAKHLKPQASKTKPVLHRDELSVQENIEVRDLQTLHLEALKSFLGPIDLSKFKIGVDSMNGAGARYLPTLLRHFGAKVFEVRSEINPWFQGKAPEPTDALTEPLKDIILQNHLDFGFAIDGDADRIAARDGRGNYVDAHRIFTLLLQHLKEQRGLSGKVIKTFSTTDMIDKRCQQLGLECEVTPIGFKHICKKMVNEEILIGGEESGGIGIPAVLPERDATLCALLLAEHVQKKGASLEQVIAELMQQVGHHEYRRLDLHLTGGPATSLIQSLKENAPTLIANCDIDRVEDLDGIKFRCKDDRWLMIRASGTEPVVRLYAEGKSIADVEAMIDHGQQLVQTHTQSNS